MTESHTLSRRALYVALALVLVGVGMLLGPLNPAKANLPANKIGVAGTGIDTLQPDTATPLFNGGQDMVLRTSSPTDLLIQVTAECDIVTSVPTTGNSTGTASAQLKLFVKLDDQIVAVGGDDANDPGKVVFCNRTHTQTVSNSSDNATITQYLKTRTANAFNWITLNVGSGTHRLQVFAEYTTPTANTAGATSSGVVGKRTLIVDPVHLSNTASI